MSTRMTSAAAVLGVVAASVIGCNAIFGVHAGRSQGSGGKGGTGGATTTGGAGGTGGASVGCQPSKPAQCAPTLLADDENCCVMGRSCQGGTCTDGECHEVEIGASPAGDEGISLVVADATVVWSSGYGRNIYTTSLDGGARTTLVGASDTDFEFITMLAVDQARRQVYFTDHGSARIGRAGLDDGIVEVFGEIAVAGAGAKAGFGRILVFEDFVYVALDRENTPPSTAGVFRAPVTATPPVTFTKVADAQGSFGLAATNGYLYFGDEATTSIKRIAVATIDQGGTPEVVVPNQPAIGELSVDADRLYWPDGHTVWAHGLEPGGPKYEVHTNDSYVWGIHVDEDYVYWSTVGDSATVSGELYRVDRALEDPAKRLMEVAAPQAFGTVAGDCDTLYTIERSKGRVVKISK